MKCGIVIVDTGPLKTLAYGESLKLLLVPDIPVYVSDMVVDELLNGSQHQGNATALEFINQHVGNEIEIIQTGVPQIYDELKHLGVDPGDESIRRIINQYEETEGLYALLVSEDDKFMRSADPFGHTYMMTTRPFLQELESRHMIDDAEIIMRKAEENAIAAGESPGRGQFDRKREWNIPPGKNQLAKPF